MNERKHGMANIAMFFDLIRKMEADPSISDILQNRQLCLLPDDDPVLAKANFERIQRQGLPDDKVAFVGVSKTKGSKQYDVFVVKETPIVLS